MVKFFALLLCIQASLSAWGEHPLGSYPALRALPELSSAGPAKVVSLNEFVEKESEGLAILLEQIEQWNQNNLAYYPKTPENLLFKNAPENMKGEIQLKRALRVNPAFKTISYVQMLPGEKMNACNQIAANKISTFEDNSYLNHLVLCALKPGETVLPVNVVATATDEPDYGLDIGLFENNNTEYGSEYGFGQQSFGNPSLAFSSQAPFHMGFFHEAWIVYKLGSFLKKTYPRMRAHQFLALSKFAFERGYDYWGYRFMGWGLHYIQDLTQPYHSASTPNMGTLKKLWVNFLSIIGFKKPMQNLIQLLSNQHLALEDLQRVRMTELIAAKNYDHPILSAVMDTSTDEQYGEFHDDYIVSVLTRESTGRAEALSGVIQETMPHNIVNNPETKYDSHHGSENIYDILKRESPQAIEKMEQPITELFRSFGAHTRNYARAALAAKK